MAERLRAGWLTRRCQTTAHSPSVWGVIRSGETVGITTQAAAAALVAPPSLPTMPNTAAPTSPASSSARTRLGDTFFSRLPPPTENTSTASRAPSRDTLSHSEKLVSQPSSLTRAVSSETLSVGA